MNGIMQLHKDLREMESSTRAIDCTALSDFLLILEASVQLHFHRYYILEHTERLRIANTKNVIVVVPRKVETLCDKGCGEEQPTLTQI